MNQPKKEPVINRRPIHTLCLAAVMSAVPLSTGLAQDVDPVPFDVDLGDLVIPAVGALEGKAQDAYFVRCDRTTMSHAELEDAFDELVAEFPRACDEDRCVFELIYDREAGAYSLEGEPGWFTVEVPDTTSEARKIPGIHKSGNVTLKRGLI